MRKSLFHRSRTAVRTAEITICAVKQLPRVFSADAWSPLPIKIEARGAPPYPMNAANAVTIIISGMQTPTPVRAAAPTPGMWPI